MISSIFVDASISFSDARIISVFMRASHIVDHIRFLIMRSLLSARSAEQLVTGSVHSIQYTAGVDVDNRTVGSKPLVE